MKITYLGHSCFKIASQDYEIVMDPYQEGSVPGYQPLHEEADQVLCSHYHRDHGALEAVTLRKGAISPFRVDSIATWHDDHKGEFRGSNTIHILDDGQVRIAHLGDLGCALTEEQKEALKGLDALLLPVGGFYTIDARQAKALAEELAPAVVIPMHYRGPGFGYDVIAPVQEYTKLCEDVVEYPGAELELTRNMPRQTALLMAKYR